MFWLIEDSEQLKEFDCQGFSEVFLEIIPLNFKTHPILDGVSLLYIKPLNDVKGYMLCINHNDTLSLSIGEIKCVLDKIGKIYVRDKKSSLQYLPLKALFDITPTSNTYIPDLTSTHTWYYKNNPTHKEINKIIPIVKHYEYCETIFGDLKPFNILCEDDYCKFFNKKSSIVFSAIEANGLKVNKELYEKNFHEISGDYVYTQYNLKTTTTRPSNTFGGVNFSALNKTNGERKTFIPRNEILVELDISAYHPTLLANLCDYDFGDGDIHQSFAQMYGVDYAQAKEITFKQIYGGIWKEYETLDFFQQVKKYTDSIWNEYNTLGRVIVPISGYCLEKEKLGEMNPQKLLNYVLQGLETANNVIILWEILRLLRGRKTKLVLYTYDAFLFDFSKEDRKVLMQVKQIFKNHKLNVKISYGTNYDFKGE